MKKLITIIIILAIGAGGGIFLANNFAPFNGITNMNITSTVKQILPAAEFASLVYHYADIITHSDTIRLFDLINIPFTERRTIYTIDGAIKLGLNCEKIEITSFSDTITLNMPAIEILSHEIYPDTFNLYDERSGLFNKYSIEDSFALQTIQRHEREKKVSENSGLFAQARTSAEHQFRGLLENMPGIKNKYKIEFKWEL